MQEKLDAIKYPDNYIVRNIIMPIGGTRENYIECLHPTDPTDVAEILDKVKKVHDTLKKWNNGRKST